MVIDFHTHEFNDKVAEIAVEKLEKVAKIKPETNGTVAKTLEKMAEWGVDKSVCLSIATKPSQFKTLFDWAVNLEGDTNGKIIPFLSIHPDSESVFDEIETIKKAGFKGVKLHPDYQNFYIDEPRMLPIYQKCADLSLPVIFHTGLDVICPNDIHATPKMILNVVKSVPKMTMICAHLGGNMLYNDVFETIAGKGENLYFDTALCSRNCPLEIMKKIIEKHGSERILFGSDCPWSSGKNEIEHIKKLELSNKDLDNILYKNAEKLLNIN